MGPQYNEMANYFWETIKIIASKHLKKYKTEHESEVNLLKSTQVIETTKNALKCIKYCLLGD